MALELVRALLAAVVVAVLPGYYWAKSLFPSVDWVGRLTSAVALSIALAPVTAWLLLQIFGGGLTVVIAAGTVIIVTAMGILLHHLCGPANVHPRAPELDVPALNTPVLLLLASALVLSIAGSLDSRDARTATIPIMGLLVGAVAVGGLSRFRRGRREHDDAPELDSAHTASHKDDPEKDVPRNDTSGQRWITLSWALPMAIFLLVLLRGYIGPALHEWPYIRGTDIYNHAIMTNLILSQATEERYMVYPPGFHLLSALLSRLSGLHPLRVYSALGPALFLLPALASYTLARVFFGYRHALVAAGFAGLLLNSPAKFIRDGQYTDIVSAHFLLVLVVVALGMLATSTSPTRASFLFAILGASIVFYHTITTLWLALLLAVVCVAYGPYLLKRNRHRGLLLVQSLAVMGAVSIWFAWHIYDLPLTIRAMLGADTPSNTSRLVDTVIGTHNPRPLQSIPGTLSEPVVWFGLAGMLLLVVNLRTIRSYYAPGAILVLGWAIVFFAGTRTSLIGFPIRLVRDLGIPLSILASVSVVAILRQSLVHRLTRLGVTVLAAVVILMQLQASFAAAASPSSAVFLAPEIASVGEWLRVHNEGGTVITSPHMNHVPSVAMMAMSGYTGLPSVPRSKLQVRKSRLLEPGLFSKATAAQSVLERPGGAVAKATLQRYDVRYVVVFKRLRQGSLWKQRRPNQWKDFSRHPSLYNVAFENESAVVFAVKPTP